MTSKGQITIPKEVRDQLGLETGTDVELVVEGTSARLRKVTSPDSLGRWFGALELPAAVDDFIHQMRDDA